MLSTSGSLAIDGAVHTIEDWFGVYADPYAPKRPSISSRNAVNL